MGNSRVKVGSSVTIVKVSLVHETYTACEHWDVYTGKRTNLKRLKELGAIGVRTEDWLRAVASMIGRRSESEDCGRPLIEVAIRGHARQLRRPPIKGDLRAASLEEGTNWTDCPLIGFGEVPVAAAMVGRVCVRRNNKMVKTDGSRSARLPCASESSETPCTSGSAASELPA